MPFSFQALEAHGHAYEITADGRIGAVIESGKPYESELLEAIYEEGFAGVAVDVGAHVGNHSLWFSLVCGLQVVAFEPINFPALCANVAHNAAPILICPVALGAEPGWAHSAGKGVLRHGDGSIPVATLDQYGLRDVAVVKIDVEGMEPQVLRGAEQMILAERPVIFAEARTDEDHVAIAEVLDTWGYERIRRFASKSVASPVEEWRS